MKSLLALLALTPLFAQADQIRLRCMPLAPPLEQGQERFFELEFMDGQATLRAADLTSPFESLTDGMPLLRAHYTDLDSSASANWNNQVELALVFLGTWWGGNLRFRSPVKTSALQFTAGTEIDLRCVERN